MSKENTETRYIIPGYTPREMISGKPYSPSGIVRDDIESLILQVVVNKTYKSSEPYKILLEETNISPHDAAVIQTAMVKEGNIQRVNEDWEIVTK